MKFRKLYWVTEQLNNDGQSQLRGVYTSIFDIRSKGFKWLESCGDHKGIRVSLVKLDSMDKPLGTWSSPNFDNMREDLQQYISTGEFDEQSCDELVEELQGFCGAPATS